MLPQEIIRKKRDNQELSTQEIAEFINGIAEKKIDDAQVAALTMAIYFNSMSKKEITALTLAMRDSGKVLSWKDFDKPIVDKHSSGGVGDKVSLILAPLLAANDVYVPMIAGRGLGHTGGTIDKLESIPNYNTSADDELFRKTVKNVGCAIIGQTADLAPADKKIYALRDVCATVESIPLITASILSKKLAAGLEYLVMDLKCGNGAFMNNFADAETLAKSIVDVANAAGTKTSALITDMNQVLGKNVGNALEISESLDFLQGKPIDSRLKEITFALGAELLVSCGRFQNKEEALAKFEQDISSGKALEIFAKMCSSLGAPTDFIEKSESYLPHSAIIKPLLATKAGYISAMNTRKIGISIIKMHGGRTIAGEKLDLATGYTGFAQIGDYVDSKTPLCYVHCQNEAQYEEIKKDILDAIEISSKAPKIIPPVMKKISTD